MNALLSNIASFFSSLFRRNGAGGASAAASADEHLLVAAGATAEVSTGAETGAADPSLKTLEEECRLALLRSPTGDLSAGLAKRVAAGFSDAESFLAPLREWADRGRVFRMESDAMVARGEDKTCFGFDSLKRDVRAHIDGVLSGDRRLSAAWFMLKPFFFEPAPPVEPAAAEAPAEPAKPAAVAPAEQPPAIPGKAFLLGEILRFASWDGRDGQKGLDEAFRTLEKHYPEAVEEGKQRIEKGRKLRAFIEKARKAGSSGKPLDEILTEMKTAGINEKFHLKLAKKAYDRGVNGRKKYFQARQLEKKMKKAAAKSGVAQAQPPKPAKTPAPETPEVKAGESSVDDLFAKIGNGHANALPSLEPASAWTILIDETGSDFSSGAAGKTRGRMVAVFVPAGTSLPDLPPKWHAVEMGALEGKDGVLDLVGRVQSAKCGVLGIPVTVLPETTEEDQWFSCVEDILSLGFRLMRIEGPSKISLFVEQRGFASGPTGSSMLSKTVADVLHRLARVFPERAKNLTVESRIVSKDEHPWNGYADAVAWTWGSTAASFLLPQTGWVGPCFLDGDAASVLRRCLDSLRTEGTPGAADWTKLLDFSASEGDTSLASAFLRALGQEAQLNASVWRSFLDETVRHLDSKAIRMNLLSAQIRWLKQWEPVDAQLPPRVRLMWLTSELAAANHAGQATLHESDAFRKEFDELCERLRREDCPLVAHAKLHLAVSYTNAFEFEKARDVLLPLRDWPVEGLGLRMEGRLLSSLGQHAAFLGDSAGALPLFDEAIALFRDLSEASRGEIAQTGAYAATASMDAKTPDAEERLAAYLWGGSFSEERFVSEARRLSASSEPIEKYAHHILLRRLVELPTDHPARTAYLAEKPWWSEPAVGHPWELIEFYRALLLPAGPERDARLESAYELAMAEGGPTLQVIAAVIAGAVVANADAAARKAYANLVACCAESLPALGDARLDALRGQLDPATRLSPLALARAILPFNFR